jgi:hypothetical protein
MTDGPKEVPKGQRFTHVYVERGKPMQDSVRMRRRLASLVDTINGFHSEDPEQLSRRAERELGIASPWSEHRSWRDFLENGT